LKDPPDMDVFGLTRHMELTNYGRGDMSSDLTRPSNRNVFGLTRPTMDVSWLAGAVV
jgi:hypothetical protein